MREDIEEHQTTILTASDSSTESPPPLEVSPRELIHESASLRTTVLDSMQQAVPIDARASTVGPKRTGLFYVGDDSIGGGKTLFSISPLVMAWKPEVTRMPDSEDVSKQNDTVNESKVCDFCFENPRTFTEHVYEIGGGTLHALPPARRCTGCNVLSFCDKTCHRKAWKQFHRFECGILKTIQRRDPIFLMYLRVLLRDKAELIPRNVMQVVSHLCLPCSSPLQPALEQTIASCSLSVYHLLSPQSHGLPFIRDLLCRILVNQVPIADADETAIVHCFDIALALLNHSCEPNAFVFFEGRHAHVRSLRMIYPGEEITIALIDTRPDVQNRREALRQQLFNDEYVCKCKVCEVELHALHRHVTGDPSQAVAVKKFYGNVILNALQLIQDIRNAVWDKQKKELTHKLVSLAEGKFVDHLGKNPVDGLNNKLIPWLHMTGAASFLEIRELEDALHYAILSNMLFEPSIDQTSVANLRTLINTLRAICELPESEKRLKKFSASRGRRFPTIQDLRALTVSCMISFCLLAHKVYGPRIGFVRAVLRWSQNEEKLCAPLKPCTSDFNAATERAQNLLRSWCLGDRTVPFYPIKVPTRAQYKAFRKMLQAREENVQQESQA